MSTTLDELLKNKLINGWKLFWLITAPISLAMVLAMTGLDLSKAEAVSSMIQLSVRCAVPLLFLVFAISAVQVLFPGSLSRWLVRNRKYIGLCFASAMGWQGFFILWLVGIHTDYYVREVYVLSDVVEGVFGYAFLLAMVMTSFQFGRRRLTPKQWKLLHRSGIYWLWIYAWSVYWFNLFYYEGPALPLDYIYYWSGLMAWCLRLVAWSKKRLKQTATQSSTSGSGTVLPMLLGVVAIAIGLIGNSFGAAWSPQVYDFLFGFKAVNVIDSFMPYFPMVPFYPLIIMILGALLIIKSKG